MSKVYFLLSIIIIVMSCSGSADTIPANHSSIEYTGRINFANTLAPEFSYSGVSIRACFTGTSVSVIFDDSKGQNYYYAIIDGLVLDKLHVTTGKKVYKLADNLTNTTHEIEIFKLTEQEFGKTTFYGFVLDNGATLTQIETKREKFIEYIGNSITCGYGNEGKNGETFGPTTENHYLTYAALTSRNFNARHMAVSKSGIGVYRNYNGPVNGNPDCMANLYTRVFLTDENPKYSFNITPDLVCINLGTNDFSVNKGDTALYISNYLRLIDTIQTKYTNPEIVCLAGPMLSPTDLVKVRKCLQFVADSATKKGKGNVWFFEMSAQGQLGYAIDYHPTIAQHKKNALELTAFIKQLKNWTINPLPLNAKTIDTKHVEVEFNTGLNTNVDGIDGFKITANNVEVNINSVIVNPDNNNLLIIELQAPVNINEQLKLFYTGSKLVSNEMVQVSIINSFIVQNTLTATSLTDAVANTKGLTVLLTVNKNVDQNIDINGISVETAHGKVNVDSFKVSGKIITLFVANKIFKGDSVFVSYTGTGIYGIDGVPLQNFSRFVVYNVSEYTNINISPAFDATIYPNPNKTRKFNYNLHNYNNNTTVLVINSEGKIVFTKHKLQPKGQLNIDSSMSAGVYIFRFVNSNETVNKTIIFE